MIVGSLFVIGLLVSTAPAEADDGSGGGGDPDYCLSDVVPAGTTSLCLSDITGPLPVRPPPPPPVYAPVFGPAQGFGVVAAGTGLRNQGGGVVTLPAIPGPIVRAFLYWEEMAPTFTALQNNAFVDGIGVSGTMIGSGSDLCWGGGATRAFRADVTTIVTAGGAHSVQTASNDVDGHDPWVGGSRTPMAEGASLVVVYVDTSRSAVVIDGYASLISTSANVLVPALPGAAGSANGRLTVIGGDGQTGANEDMQWNGNVFATNTWDGSDPQLWPGFVRGHLWDTDTFSNIIAGQGANTLTIRSQGDCIGPEVVIFTA